MSGAVEALVDTHCHLTLLDDRGLLDAALESAASAGVVQIVAVGIDLGDDERCRRLAEAHPGVFFTVGWHPTLPAPPDGSQLAALAELAAHPRCVGVGEVGLDYHWRPGYHETPAEVQAQSLHAMLELAAEHSLPVVIHDREAHDDVVAALGPAPRRADPGRPRGVLHCFSGDAALAATAATLGMLCSFAGTVTFPRTDALREAAATAADEVLVVETDAPFLAPVPHRGRTNLPGYVADTAAAVAALRGARVDDLRRLTTMNARRLFGLPDAGDVIGA